MSNLVFDTFSLSVKASIIIFLNMKKMDSELTENKANPFPIGDGRYAIKKPGKEYLKGIQDYKEIKEF